MSRFIPRNLRTIEAYEKVRIKNMCPQCKSILNVKKAGTYRIKSSDKPIQRFQCLNCQMGFSERTLAYNKYEKKKDLLVYIYRQLVAGTSQRETARLLSISRNTVDNNLAKLAKAAINVNSYLLEFFPKVSTVCFDEQETFEHSKWKPITIPVAVDKETRLMLGFKMGTIPARTNYQKAILKYGPRDHESELKTAELFSDLKILQLKNIICNKVEFISDKKSSYPNIVYKYFPDAKHWSHKGRKAAVAGQGELKVGGYDPLFSINHTLATIRYRLQTMVRQTWCTTKKMEFLEMRMFIFQAFFNICILQDLGVVK